MRAYNVGAPTLVDIIVRLEMQILDLEEEVKYWENTYSALAIEHFKLKNKGEQNGNTKFKSQKGAYDKR